MTLNDLDEVTEVEVRKGKTREIVKRHVSSVIPLLKVSKLPSNDHSGDSSPSDLSTDGNQVPSPSVTAANVSPNQRQTRPRRKAVIRSNARMQEWINS